MGGKHLLKLAIHLTLIPVVSINHMTFLPHCLLSVEIERSCCVCMLVILSTLDFTDMFTYM